MGLHLLSAVAIDITPGVHEPVKSVRLTIDLDIVWATVIAGLIVITLGLVLRAKATSGVPGKFQLMWEMAVEAVQKQVESTRSAPAGPRSSRWPSPCSSSSSPPTCSRCSSIGSTIDLLPAADQRHQPALGHGPLS